MQAGVHVLDVVPSPTYAAAPTERAKWAPGQPAHGLQAVPDPGLDCGIDTKIGDARHGVHGRIVTELVDEAGMAAFEGPEPLFAHCSRSLEVVGDG